MAVLYSCRKEKQCGHESKEGKEQTKEVMKIYMSCHLVNTVTGFNLMQHHIIFSRLFVASVLWKVSS